jgi:hypothetical protein
MIRSILQRSDNLIEINLIDRNDYISCQVMYSTDNITWNTAAIYPDINSEFILNGCDFLWSQGQEDGVVRLYDKDNYSIYWNYILDISFYTGKIYIKIILITEKNIYEDNKDICIKDVGVVYLSDWEGYLGEKGSCNPKEDEDKWYIAESKPFNFIGMKYKKFLPDIKIPVNFEGCYDIYIGMKTGAPVFLIRTEDSYFERLICGGSSMSLYKSNFAGKSNKEIYWKSSCFSRSSNSYIEISQLQETINSFQDMGNISYIKLVPNKGNNNFSNKDNYSKDIGKSFINLNIYSNSDVSSNEDENTNSDKYRTETHSNINAYSNNNDKEKEKLYPGELILYYEPYSYTLHGFHNAESMNNIMLEEFVRMNPKEITCQTVRIGSKCLHHSKFLERNDKAARTDLNTIIDDPAKLAQNCDILKESIKYIQGRGIRLTANIGMNRPYIWSPEISEKFTSDNTELLLDGYFDYKRNEVQEYALRIIYEIIDNYDIDGMFFDYMRSYNNQTVESLVHTIKMTKGRLNEKGVSSGKKLELKARIPADQIIYYQAMKICVENGYIDGIVPSNIVTSEPLPPVKHYIEVCKGTGTKVYGCIDGWKYTLGGDPRAGSMDFTHTPKDIIRYFNHYNQEGVDGVFIYQADQITANPYTSSLFAYSNL